MTVTERCPYTVGNRVCVAGPKGHAGRHLWPVHRLVSHGKGERRWAECSCGLWAWVGTYDLPTGRLAKIRAAFAAHQEATR